MASYNGLAIELEIAYTVWSVTVRLVEIPPMLLVVRSLYVCSYAAAPVSLHQFKQNRFTILIPTSSTMVAAIQELADHEFSLFKAGDMFQSSVFD